LGNAVISSAGPGSPADIKSVSGQGIKIAENELLEIPRGIGNRQGGMML